MSQAQPLESSCVGVGGWGASGWIAGESDAVADGGGVGVGVAECVGRGDDVGVAEGVSEGLEEVDRDGEGGTAGADSVGEGWAPETWEAWEE